MEPKEVKIDEMVKTADAILLAKLEEIKKMECASLTENELSILKMVYERAEMLPGF